MQFVPTMPTAARVFTEAAAWTHRNVDARRAALADGGRERSLPAVASRVAAAAGHGRGGGLDTPERGDRGPS